MQIPAYLKERPFVLGFAEINNLLCKKGYALRQD